MKEKVDKPLRELKNTDFVEIKGVVQKFFAL